MEKYYTKDDRTGRYTFAGYHSPNLPPGIYCVHNTKYGKRTTSMAYWMGDSEEPIDAHLAAKVMKLDDKVCDVLNKLSDPESQEYKKIKQEQGGWVFGPLKLYNFSPYLLSQIILREVYKELNANSV